MPTYQKLANNDDLKEFLDVEEVPEACERLLQRASELIYQATFTNLDLNNDKHVEAVKLATCAQVEYWLEVGEMFAFVNGVRSLSIDSFQIEFSPTNQMSESMDKGQLANRARNFLLIEGLLYRGM